MVMGGIGFIEGIGIFLSLDKPRDFDPVFFYRLKFVSLSCIIEMTTKLNLHHH